MPHLAIIITGVLVAITIFVVATAMLLESREEDNQEPEVIFYYSEEQRQRNQLFFGEDLSYINGIAFTGSRCPDIHPLDHKDKFPDSVEVFRGKVNKCNITFPKSIRYGLSVPNL